MIVDGGQAFPHPNMTSSGMSLRDWFAGQVLRAVYADYATGDDLPKGTLRDIAIQCYTMADAMLEARK